MFLAKFNCTCCLLKMALEAAWSINSSTFIFSTQRKGQFAGHSCYRVDGSVLYLIIFKVYFPRTRIFSYKTTKSW